MITGVVTAFHQATIRLIVRGPTGQAQEIEAVIDTGFDGALSLPPADIAALGLPWRRRGRALLADGTTSLFDIYEATVLWDGALRRVAVDAADIDPLVGMCLLDGYELTVQVFEDRVTWVVSDTGYCLLYLVPSRAEEVTVGKRQVNWVLYKNVADTALSGVLTDAHGVVHPTSLPPGVASAAQVAHIHHRARQQFPGYVADAVCATPSPFIQAVFDLSIPHYRRGRLCLIWDASTLCRPHVPLNARARTAA